MTLKRLERIVSTIRIVDTMQNESGAIRMTWVPLESEMLASVAYDVERRKPDLRFRSGDVYRYFEFKLDNYRALLDAESHGRFFLAHIRELLPLRTIG